MNDDAELLRQYAGSGSEPAFAELVQRHIDLVYFAALRRCGGDAHQAEDVTQQVFVALARNAPALAGHPVLVGWLYTTTRHLSAKARRAEHNRRAREEVALAMNEPMANSPAEAVDWERLRPVLDDVLDDLSETDRDAILLRFFQDRPFADIGRALRLSDDAARMRVERALERLRGLFARRGITSTSAALALALAHQAALAKPAGLAASVTASALAGAAAAGAAGAGVATIGFMSTAKISGGVLVVVAALVLSVATNAYLFLHPRAPAVAFAAAGPLPSAIGATVTGELPLAVLQGGDIAALRDRMRAAGASETAVRGVIEGVLRRRYREELSALRAERMQHAWWSDTGWWYQSGRSDGPPRFVDDKKLLREMVLDPLDQLFGPDPAEVAEQQARFEFLPAEKRDAFAALERDFAAATARLAGAEQNSAAGSALQREHDEKQQALLATLTPAERAEYDLHLSATAVALRERMSQINASEQEYRAIMAVVPAPADPADQNAPVRRILGASENDAGVAQQLVAALGYDRALDYLWAGAWEYPSYARVAQDAGLPPGTPARLLELGAETIAQAETIHRDETLTPAQRRAAVIALQEQVRPQLDALLPPDQQQRLPARTLLWFTALGEGRYTSIPTTAAGNTGGVMSGGPGILVDSPPPANRARSQFVVPRPPGR
jgi:RNA polymerase sigma factor (sigma-70 family)